MLSHIEIYGDGMAAACCAKLLQLRGLNVAFNPTPATSAVRPVLLINPQTRKLISDVFGEGETLFSAARVINRRVVLWGASGEPQSFPHSGVAIREGALLEQLWSKIACGQPVSRPPDWSIHSSRPSAERTEHSFGARLATASTATLTNPENDACWIESTIDGWLFIVPIGYGSASLLSVGAPPATLLSQSRLISSQIKGLVGEGVEFKAYPRIFIPFGAPGWLACGTAAMAFDPICGEGAGHAVREAILASAVLGAIYNGAASDTAVEQYNTRLLAGFARHLELCKQFYLSGRQGDWWDAELTALDQGIDWTREQLKLTPSPSSRLVGFDLQPRG